MYPSHFAENESAESVVDFPDVTACQAETCSNEPEKLTMAERVIEDLPSGGSFTRINYNRHFNLRTLQMTTFS